ncbi:MAG: hypothetical protein ACK5G7_00405 [Erysipelotrichaceae bacterium]
MSYDDIIQRVKNIDNVPTSTWKTGDPTEYFPDDSIRNGCM